MDEQIRDKRNLEKNNVNFNKKTYIRNVNRKTNSSRVTLSKEAAFKEIIETSVLHEAT